MMIGRPRRARQVTGKVAGEQDGDDLSAAIAEDDARSGAGEEDPDSQSESKNATARVHRHQRVASGCSQRERPLVPSVR